MFVAVPASIDTFIVITGAVSGISAAVPEGECEMSKKKLAVIFPGIGYHCDKPLLYHTKKIAAAHGYEVREVPYTGFPAKVKGDPEKMRQSFMLAMQQAQEILADVKWDPCEELLFVSKSVGTVVAAAFADQHSLVTGNIYFTPVKATFDFHPQPGIVFHGTADPWATDAEIEEGCRRCALPLINIPDTNHSLESGDPLRDLDILRQVMEQVDNYVNETASQASAIAILA